MYEPPLFREDRLDVMHASMRAHPFATLVSTTDGRLTADHLPLVLDTTLHEKGVLRGHIARANPLRRSPNTGGDTLVIFHGPQTYVTPSWYPSKRDHGKVVPTWNYVVVHAYGPLRIIEDRDWLRQNVSELTDAHERDRAEPWRLSDAPESFVDQMLRGIVGLEIEITELNGKWKMSQNRTPEDRAGVVRGLRDEGGDAAQLIATMIASQRTISCDDLEVRHHPQLGPERTSES